MTQSQAIRRVRIQSRTIQLPPRRRNAINRMRRPKTSPLFGLIFGLAVLAGMVAICISAGL